MGKRWISPMMTCNRELGPGWTPPLCNGNPTVVYRQGNQKTCLFCATSSVLAYYRDHQGAKVIDEKKNLKLPVDETNFQVINQTLASTSNKLS
eukprot:13210380-Ditylum_brightwellii.AAC.1